MKNRLFSLMLLAAVCALVACSDDDEKDSGINHVGEQWKITSVEYQLINQSTKSQVNESGTATDAGFFYFDGTKGSFDLTIEGIHKEDVFNYSENAPSVSVSTISQSASGSSISQNVITMSGEKTSATSMMLDGSITKQTTSSQFILTANFTLVKQ
jgi:hypothetical protein